MLRPLVSLVLVAAWLPLVAESLAADSPGPPPAGEALYREECGSCHLAYPPRFLPRSSWDAILADLDRHFGENAAVDAATLTELRTYLASKARKPRKSDTKPDGSPILRITDSRWFRGEHRKMERKNVWQRASIGSAANCQACHRDAEQGKFGEHGIRVPK